MLPLSARPWRQVPLLCSASAANACRRGRTGGKVKEAQALQGVAGGGACAVKQHCCSAASMRPGARDVEVCQVAEVRTAHDDAVAPKPTACNRVHAEAHGRARAQHVSARGARRHLVLPCQLKRRGARARRRQSAVPLLHTLCHTPRTQQREPCSAPLPTVCCWPSAQRSCALH
jgi:hypothetical protein